MATVIARMQGAEAADLVEPAARARAPGRRGLGEFYDAFNTRDGPAGQVVDALAAHSAVHNPRLLLASACTRSSRARRWISRCSSGTRDCSLRTGDQEPPLELAEHLDAAPLAAPEPP